LAFAEALAMALAVQTLLAGNPIAPQIFREAYNSTILSSRHSSDTSQAFHGHNH
jgi:hypothetical protein